MDYEKKIREYLNSDKVDQLYKSMLLNLFPEIAESEDEKIRKSISYILNNADYSLIDNTDFTVSEMEAWLEKQGEHANFRNNIQIGDRVTRNEDGVLVNLSQLNRVAKKQGEQKPIKVPKFKAGDFIQFNGMGHTRYTIKEVCGLSHYINTCNKRMDMSYTDANFELVEQKPAEWSEEDKQTIEDIIRLLEDIVVIDTHCDTTSIKWYINWLKSLRHQKQWKPSQEQMEALCVVLEHGVAVPDREASLAEKHLEELLKQLKAL